MYVCHCNSIPERDIRSAIDELAARNASATASAADVLLMLNRFGKCLGCFPLIEAMLAGNDHPSPATPAPERLVQIDQDNTKRPRRRRGGAFARRTEP